MATINLKVTPLSAKVVLKVNDGDEQVSYGETSFTAEINDSVTYTVSFEQCEEQKFTKIITQKIIDEGLSVDLTFSGLVIVDAMVPLNDVVPFPTHVANLGKGGWQSVPNITARDNIIKTRRTEGMAVYVESEQKLYTLNSDLENWTLFETGKIDKITVNNVEQTIVDKTVNIEVPTKTSDLTNDSGFITKDVDNLTNYTKSTDLATVATSGSYTDLSNTPTKVSEFENDANYQTDTDVSTSITNNIVNNVTSTDIDKSLSANMGKELQDQINNLEAIGRFLSNWNCATGLPTTNPTVSPYIYHTGDYYLVSNIATEEPSEENNEENEEPTIVAKGETEVVEETTNELVNYKPSGTSYTKDVASTEVETEEVSVGDFYIFDGTTWKLLKNTEKTITFSNIAGEPTDNTNLASALNAKQDKLTAGTGITITDENVISAKEASATQKGIARLYTSLGSSTLGSVDQNTITTSLAGKQATITTTNKLLSDLVDDTAQTNKFVTDENKSAWNDAKNKADAATANITTMQQSIALMKTDIETNTANIETNTANIATNTTNISNETLNRISSDDALLLSLAHTDEVVSQFDSRIVQNSSDIYDLDDTLTTNYYTKSEVDGKVVGLYHIKGTVLYYTDLPDDPETGDVYNVRYHADGTPFGMNYVWDGGEWDELGDTFDMSAYRKATEQDVIDAKKQDKLKNGTDISIVANTVNFTGKFGKALDYQNKQLMLKDQDGVVLDTTELAVTVDAEYTDGDVHFNTASESEVANLQSQITANKNLITTVNATVSGHTTAIADLNTNKQDTLPDGTTGYFLKKTDDGVEWDEAGGTITDVKVDNVSVVTEGVASIDLSGKQDVLPDGTTGLFLQKTDSGVTWAEAGGGGSGTVTDVQYNNTSTVDENGVSSLTVTNGLDIVTANDSGTSMVNTRKGQYFRGIFDTYAHIPSTINGFRPDPQGNTAPISGDWIIISNDETHGNLSYLYTYDESVSETYYAYRIESHNTTYSEHLNIYTKTTNIAAETPIYIKQELNKVQLVWLVPSVDGGKVYDIKIWRTFSGEGLADAKPRMESTLYYTGDIRPLHIYDDDLAGNFESRVRTLNSTLVSSSYYPIAFYIPKGNGFVNIGTVRSVSSGNITSITVENPVVSGYIKDQTYLFTRYADGDITSNQSTGVLSGSYAVSNWHEQGATTSANMSQGRNVQVVDKLMSVPLKVSDDKLCISTNNLDETYKFPQYFRSFNKTSTMVVPTSLTKNSIIEIVAGPNDKTNSDTTKGYIFHTYIDVEAKTEVSVYYSGTNNKLFFSVDDRPYANTTILFNSVKTIKVDLRSLTCYVDGVLLAKGTAKDYQVGSETTFRVFGSNTVTQQKNGGYCDIHSIKVTENNILKSYYIPCVYNKLIMWYDATHNAITEAYTDGYLTHPNNSYISPATIITNDVQQTIIPGEGLVYDFNDNHYLHSKAYKAGNGIYINEYPLTYNNALYITGNGQDTFMLDGGHEFTSHEKVMIDFSFDGSDYPSIEGANHYIGLFGIDGSSYFNEGYCLYYLTEPQKFRLEFMDQYVLIDSTIFGYASDCLEGTITFDFTDCSVYLNDVKLIDKATRITGHIFNIYMSFFGVEDTYGGSSGVDSNVKISSYKVFNTQTNELDTHYIPCFANGKFYFYDRLQMKILDNNYFFNGVLDNKNYRGEIELQVKTINGESIVGTGNINIATGTMIDGGRADSVYTITQHIDCGGANNS